jgi:hypothetical protein
MARRNQGLHNLVELTKAYCSETDPSSRHFDDLSRWMKDHPYAISPGQMKRFASICASFGAEPVLDDSRRYEILHENPLIRFDKVTLSLEQPLVTN